MATLGELRLRILRLLDDPEGAGYPNELLFDGMSAALDAILPWAPKTATITLACNGVLTTFALPADLYDIESLVAKNGEVLPRISLSPGNFLGVSAPNPYSWLEYPAGSVSFGKAPPDIVTLYYLAYWDKPSTFNADFVLTTPGYVIHGLALYSMAYALNPAAVGVAEINPYKTRVDSGTPEHNPLQRSVSFIMEAFTREMNRHPKHMRAVK